MQIVAGETHSCCHDVVRSWSHKGQGLSRPGGRWLLKPQTTTVPSAPPAVHHTIRKEKGDPSLEPRVQMNPRRFQTPPGCLGNWWAPSNSPRLVTDCWERGLPCCSTFAQRFLAMCLPSSGTFTAAVVLLAYSIRRRSPCLHPSLFQSLSLPRCLRVYVGKHVLTAC